MNYFYNLSDPDDNEDLFADTEFEVFEKGVEPPQK